MHIRFQAPGGEIDGFTLLETLIVLFILSFGLIAAGQLICLAVSCSALAGSKGSAAIVADSKLAFLTDLYRRNPTAAELSLGVHDPEIVQICNPHTHHVINRFEIFWAIEQVPDPRPGKVIPARRIRVDVVPVDAEGKQHFVALMNKAVAIASVVSSRDS